MGDIWLHAPGEAVPYAGACRLWPQFPRTSGRPGLARCGRGRPLPGPAPGPRSDLIRGPESPIKGKAQVARPNLVIRPAGRGRAPRFDFLRRLPVFANEPGRGPRRGPRLRNARRFPEERRATRRVPRAGGDPRAPAGRGGDRPARPRRPPPRTLREVPREKSVPPRRPVCPPRMQPATWWRKGRENSPRAECRAKGGIGVQGGRGLSLHRDLKGHPVIVGFQLKGVKGEAGGKCGGSCGGQCRRGI